VEIGQIAFTQANLTIAFESVDSDLVRRDLIRKHFQGEDILITDVPNNGVFVIFQQKSIQANYANNRLSINLPVKGTIDDGIVASLSEVSSALINAVPGVEIKAYGFNLDGKCMTTDGDVNQHFKDVFYGGGQRFKDLIDADIVLAAPTFSFNKFGASFVLSFNPIENESDSFAFRCNIHFVSTALPEKSVLSQQFMDYVEYFKDILGML
jgi:hypothetical protein